MGLTRDLARQWGGRKGIRVNAIAPGFFDTEMTTQYPEGYFETLLPRISLGRKGHPDELAGTLIWLASAAGGYVTGQTIVADASVRSVVFLFARCSLSGEDLVDPVGGSPI